MAIFRCHFFTPSSAPSTFRRDSRGPSFHAFYCFSVLLLFLLLCPVPSLAGGVSAITFPAPDAVLFSGTNNFTAVINNGSKDAGAAAGPVDAERDHFCFHAVNHPSGAYTQGATCEQVAKLGTTVNGRWHSQSGQYQLKAWIERHINQTHSRRIGPERAVVVHLEDREHAPSGTLVPLLPAAHDRSSGGSSGGSSSFFSRVSCWRTPREPEFTNGWFTAHEALWRKMFLEGQAGGRFALPPLPAGSQNQVDEDGDSTSLPTGQATPQPGEARARRRGPLHLLEIGSFEGRSAFWMLDKLLRVVDGDDANEGGPSNSAAAAAASGTEAEQDSGTGDDGSAQQADRNCVSPSSSSSSQSDDPQQRQQQQQQQKQQQQQQQAGSCAPPPKPAVSTLTCVDTFQGSVEHHAYEQHRLTSNTTLNRFLLNMCAAGPRSTAKVRVFQGASLSALAALLAEREEGNTRGQQGGLLNDKTAAGAATGGTGAAAGGATVSSSHGKSTTSIDAADPGPDLASHGSEDASGSSSSSSSSSSSGGRSKGGVGNGGPVASSRRTTGALPDGLFDLIYVDGSHFAKDVLSDSVLGWELLRVGGVMVWGDYRWSTPWDDVKNPLPPHATPRAAVDGFLAAHGPEATVLHKGYQVMARKEAENAGSDEKEENEKEDPHTASGGAVVKH